MLTNVLRWIALQKGSTNTERLVVQNRKPQQKSFRQNKFAKTTMHCRKIKMTFWTRHIVCVPFLNDFWFQHGWSCAKTAMPCRKIKMTPSNQTDCLQWFTRFSDELCFLMQFGTTFSENLTRNSTLTKVQLKNCHWTQWMWREKCSNKHWTFWIGCGKQFWAFWFVSHDEKVNGQILFGETMPRQKCWWALTKCAMSKENVALQGTDGCISQLIVFWSSLSHQKVISQSGMKAWNCLPKPEKENHVGGIPTTQMWCGTSSNQPVPFHHKMTETLTPKTFALWGNVWSC